MAYNSSAEIRLQSMLKYPLDIYERTGIRQEITLTLREMCGEQPSDSVIVDLAKMIWKYSDLNERLSVQFAKDYMENTEGRIDTEELIVNVFLDYYQKSKLMKSSRLEKESKHREQRADAWDYKIKSLSFWDTLKKLKAPNNQRYSVYSLQKEVQGLKERVPAEDSEELRDKISSLEKQIAGLVKQNVEEKPTDEDRLKKLERQVARLSQELRYGSLPVKIKTFEQDGEEGDDSEDNYFRGIDDL